MTATLHDLLKSYREGGVFPSYDQLAAIAGQDQSGAAVRGEAVAMPQFPWNPDPINHEWTEREIAAINAYGKACYQAGEVSARAADAPSEPSELHWREKCSALIDIWDDAQANPPESRCYVEDAWPTMINEVRAELSATVKSRAADALDSQPTVSAVLAELRADLRELANNTEAFGEYSQEAVRVAFDSATDALDEVAAKYATSQPTDGGVRNG